ncbi:unnamed protein product [Mytilus coruscus]|uniref:C1q domain-containing protein n=1 Tax=Mytilus coruscus TaxID=42192 RepID=A0A6J8BMF8_MYTCO|nr:unnamed protein product [Mytilus coruscus]
MIGILARSLGSESESLLSCSKFQKVLEKFVRLEFKMEVYAEKIKHGEEFVSSSFDKVTEAKKQTETFVESMRNTFIQDQTRFNDSFIEVKKQTETFVDSIRDAHLQDQTRFNDSFLEAKKQTEIFVDSMRDAHLQDQTRFNDSFLVVRKHTETFVGLMRNAYLQDQTRFNNSFLETVDRFKLQSENETEFYQRRMNPLLDSFSSKVQDLSEAEHRRESTMNLSLLQEQSRFNESFDKIVENFQVRFNKSLQEIALKQKKVARTACRAASRVSVRTVVHFPIIKTNIGITDLSAYKSTGKFVCTVAGLYHVSAVMMSNTNDQYYYIFKNNDNMIITYYGKVEGYYQTRTRVFVTMLDVDDEISVRTGGSQFIYGNSCFTIVKLN